MRKLILLCISGLSFQVGFAQSSLMTNILKYKLADGSSYIDVCIDIASVDMDIELIDSLWHAHKEIIISVEDAGELAVVRKVILEGPPTSDSLIAHTGSHFHLERIKLKHGNQISNIMKLIYMIESLLLESIMKLQMVHSSHITWKFQMKLNLH